MASHLSERNSEIGLFPGLRYGALRHPAHVGMRYLIVRGTNDGHPTRFQSEVRRHVLHAAGPKEPIVDVRRFRQNTVAVPVLPQKLPQFVQQFRVRNNRPILQVVSEHKRRLDYDSQLCRILFQFNRSPFESFREAALFEQLSKHAAFFLGMLALKHAHAAAIADLALRYSFLTPCPRQEIFAYLCDLLGERFFTLVCNQLILFV